MYICKKKTQTSYLIHHGIKGQKWGIRRYQNPDGTLTAEGRQRYGGGDLNADLMKMKTYKKGAYDYSFKQTFGKQITGIKNIVTDDLPSSDSKSKESLVSKIDSSVKNVLTPANAKKDAKDFMNDIDKIYGDKAIYYDTLDEWINDAQRNRLGDAGKFESIKKELDNFNKNNNKSAIVEQRVADLLGDIGKTPVKIITETNWLGAPKNSYDTTMAEHINKIIKDTTYIPSDEMYLGDALYETESGFKYYKTVMNELLKNGYYIYD